MLTAGASTNPLLFRNPWPSGRAAGQDRRVRRARQRRVGDGRLETHAAPGQRVEGRRHGSLTSVAPEVVRAQRVDRHEQHIGAFRRRGGRRDVAPTRGSRRQYRQHDREPEDAPHGCESIGEPMTRSS